MGRVHGESSAEAATENMKLLIAFAIALFGVVSAEPGYGYYGRGYGYGGYRGGYLRIPWLLRQRIRLWRLRPRIRPWIRLWPWVLRQEVRRCRARIWLLRQRVRIWTWLRTWLRLRTRLRLLRMKSSEVHVDQLERVQHK